MTATTLHKLHYTTTTTPLRYNYNYSRSTPHYIQQLWVRWPLQPLQPFQQTQIQPPFGQSVDSLRHPWFTTTNLSYRFPILKLPPPPCAVLLVSMCDCAKNAKKQCKSSAWNILRRGCQGYCQFGKTTRSKWVLLLAVPLHSARKYKMLLAMHFFSSRTKKICPAWPVKNKNIFQMWKASDWGGAKNLSENTAQERTRLGFATSCSLFPDLWGKSQALELKQQVANQAPWDQPIPTNKTHTVEKMTWLLCFKTHPQSTATPARSPNITATSRALCPCG